MNAQTLHIDGRDKTLGTSNHFDVVIPPGLITCRENETIAMTLHDFMTPYTFYPINSSNNQFIFNGTQYSITPGYYDHDSLVEELKTHINQAHYSVSIEERTGRLVITMITGHFNPHLSFPTTNAADRVLGFTSSKTASTITGDNSVNVTPNYAIFVHVLHETKNLQNAGGSMKQSNVIGRIPLLVPPMSVIYGSGFAPHQMVFSNKYVSELSIKITNDRNEDIELSDDVQMTFTFQTLGEKGGDGSVPLLTQVAKSLENINKIQLLKFLQ